MDYIEESRFVACVLCLGGGDCDPGESHENNVVVYGRSEGRRERVVLDTLPYSSYRVRHATYVHTTIYFLFCFVFFPSYMMRTLWLVKQKNLKFREIENITCFYVTIF